MCIKNEVRLEKSRSSHKNLKSEHWNDFILILRPASSISAKKWYSTAACAFCPRNYTGLYTKKKAIAGIHWAEGKDIPNPVHLSQRLMRIIDNLLKSEETTETTHWFRSQTTKQNKWGKMYPLSKVRRLTAEEITQVETYPPKSLNKTLPGHPCIE